VTSGVCEVTPENDWGKSKQVDVLMQKPLKFWTSVYKSRVCVLVTSTCEYVTSACVLVISACVFVTGACVFVISACVFVTGACVLVTSACVLVITPLAFVTYSDTRFVYASDMERREIGFEARGFLRWKGIPLVTENVFRSDLWSISDLVAGQVTCFRDLWARKIAKSLSAPCVYVTCFTRNVTNSLAPPLNGGDLWPVTWTDSHLKHLQPCLKVIREKKSLLMKNLSLTWTT
jgi:hypothetical protein